MENQDQDNEESQDLIFTNKDMETIYYALQAYRVHNKVMHLPVPYPKRFDKLIKHAQHPAGEFNVTTIDTRLMVKALHYVQNYTDEFEYMCKASDFNAEDIKGSLKILPKLTSKIEDYSGECVQGNTDPIELQKRLSKDIRFAKHGFVREALDDVFKDLSIDPHTATRFPYDMASALALHVNNQNPLGDDTEFFILQSVILGTEHFLDTCNSDDPDIPDQIDMLDGFKEKQDKKVKYVLCHDTADGGTKITKVDKKNCIKFIQAIKDFCDSITMPSIKTY